MPVRAIAFFLALVLSWAAFTTHGQAASAVATNAEQMDLRLAASPADRLHDGSAGDPHLDDAPAQTHAESSPELQALILARIEAPLRTSGMSHPRAHATPARAAPYLDGPQRPPRAQLA